MHGELGEWGRGWGFMVGVDKVSGVWYVGMIFTVISMGGCRLYTWLV